MDQASVEGSLYIYRLYSLHRLWTLLSCSSLRNRNGHGLAHMHPLPLCKQIRLQLLSSMLGRLHIVHIHLCSFSPNTFLVHHKHMQSSAILKLAHFGTHTYACMHARTCTWCLLTFAPTMPCIRLLHYCI